MGTEKCFILQDILQILCDICKVKYFGYALGMCHVISCIRGQSPEGQVRREAGSTDSREAWPPPGFARESL